MGEKSWKGEFLVGVAILVVAGILGKLLEKEIGIDGAGPVKALDNPLAANGRPGFEGGDAGVDGLGPPKDDGAVKHDDEHQAGRREVAKPRVFCDTHSQYSVHEFIKLPGGDSQCPHCGAVGRFTKEPESSELLFIFNPNQTPRKLPDLTPGWK